MKYCSKCGSEIHDDAILCTKCGCVVDVETEKLLKGKFKTENSTVEQTSNEKANGIASLIFGAISILFAIFSIWGQIAHDDDFLITVKDGISQVYSGYAGTVNYILSFIFMGLLLTSVIGLFLGLKAKIKSSSKLGLVGMILSAVALFVGFVVVTVVIMAF